MSNSKEVVILATDNIETSHQKTGLLQSSLRIPLKEQLGIFDTKAIKIPLVEQLMQETVHNVKVPIKETSCFKSKKMPIKETAWLLVGFVIEENVIDWFKIELPIVENVQNKIIANMELLDRNNVKISWIGDKVDYVEIYQKYQIDSNFGEPIAIVKWEEDGKKIHVDDNSYHFKLLGSKGSGSSDLIAIGDTQYNYIKTDIDIPENEKNIYIDIAFVSEYKIEVNL